ncbi:MAG: transglycosylase domain-containing protein, partial [Thermoleophilaceae bacterium]|nr:transglycosylase domain-containing protein [Thermoleophilaceae bacterium]
MADPPAKPKLKKLRLAVILSGLGGLALVSTVFGMMMAVSSDLPDLENRKEYQRSQNSVVVPEPTRKGERPPPLATLTNNQNRILVGASEISPSIKNAVISIEDRRFYEHEGVDYKGIARAFAQDIRQKRAAQGGSTITQQFVKNALAAQADRSVFQKVRESALAYHLERKWTKQKVLTQYLNSVYFGNGAYGVEAAVRTYFGGTDDPSGSASADPTGLATAEAGGRGSQSSDAEVGRPAASVASPAQAALLAGMIASPSLYDPVQNPVRAKERRDTVLDRMVEQEMISRREHREALAQALPTEAEIDPPQPDSKQPYFTSWLTQQLVERYKAPAVFTGGLRVKTTLDPELQAAAEQAITGRLAGVGPSASLVAIENRTGEVKAMVGGTDFGQKPFNLATNGHRQPGSSFKPFTLIRALQDGVSPEATFTSQKKIFPVRNSGGEKFVVNNYEDSYAGVASLRSATARSDNSVYAELGLKVGPRRIAALARKMGLDTRVSTNPAMTLGGLAEGLTPLELAYAYSTIANKGVRVSGTLDTTQKGSGPVAIERVEGGGREDRNKPIRERVFPEAVGETTQQLLAGVVQGGTGKAAEIGEFAAGKTGTTENYGDAWFVGFNKELTVAVWVGYPEKLTFMKTEYGGSPVAGGTYPTEIWHDFMRSWIGVRERRQAESGETDDEEDRQEETVPAAPAAPAGPEGESTAPPEDGSKTPEQPEKEQAEPRAPAKPQEP